MSPIPQEWIRNYVDTLLLVAGKFSPGAMQNAAMLRADHVMDLVKAWQEYDAKQRGEQ